MPMCIVSPGKTVPLVRMNLGIRPVSALMRPLLLRGALAGVMLLTAGVAGRAAPPEHVLLAQSASINALSIPDSGFEAIPRRPTGHSLVNPSVPPRVVAI